MLHCGVYEWIDDGGLKRKHGPTMIYLIFKGIIPATMIGNLKYEIEISTLAKFEKNVKYLLDDMYSNYSIIIYK